MPPSRVKRVKIEKGRQRGEDKRVEEGKIRTDSAFNFFIVTLLWREKQRLVRARVQFSNTVS